MKKPRASTGASLHVLEELGTSCNSSVPSQLSEGSSLGMSPDALATLAPDPVNFQSDTEAIGALTPDTTNGGVNNTGVLPPEIASALGPKRTGAIYARFSTKFQSSIEDQVRICRQWADAHRIDVPADMVFVDRETSGRRERRSGLIAMREAMAAGRVDVIVVMCTSRIFRKMHKAIRFVEEEVVEKRRRCVFVSQGIDTDDKQNWGLLLKIHALTDEMQTSLYTANIHASHVGLLLQRMVFGTLSYGYIGVDIDGPLTKRGKRRKMIEIDPATAEWALKIFRWRVDERLSYPDIARRLNASGAPLPPRCATGRWTDLAVKKILRNGRYRGDWDYGRTECIWQSTEDYNRQCERAEPLKTVHFEELRIVDEATWFAAQAVAREDPHNAGRKANPAAPLKLPKILNGLLCCGYHRDRRMVTGGGRGRKLLCPVCKATDGELFSQLDRITATETLCRRVAELVAPDEELVEFIVGGFQAAIAAHQRPDVARVPKLKAQLKKLTQQIQWVMSNVGDTDADRDESARKVRDLRVERAAVEGELANLEQQSRKELKLPSREEVMKVLKELQQVLLAAAGGNDGSHVVRQVLDLITGGRIYAYQAGPAERQRGWLRLEFSCDLFRAVSDRLGSNLSMSEPSTISVEMREPPIHERISDEAKRLFDEGLKIQEIAARVGYNRNLVAEALGFWHKSRGLSAPDFRSLVKRLRGPVWAERHADQVMAFVDAKLPLGDIGAKFHVSRARITEAIRVWHERRKLPVPDGRSLRKLRSKRGQRPRAS